MRITRRPISGTSPQLYEWRIIARVKRYLKPPERMEFRVYNRSGPNETDPEVPPEQADYRVFVTKNGTQHWYGFLDLLEREDRSMTPENLRRQLWSFDPPRRTGIRGDPRDIRLSKRARAERAPQLGPKEPWRCFRCRTYIIPPSDARFCDGCEAEGVVRRRHLRETGELIAWKDNARWMSATVDTT